MRQTQVDVCCINGSNPQRIRNTNPQQKFRRRRNRLKQSIAWKILKTIFFIMCLLFFFYQSASFLNAYYKYSTTTRFSVINPVRFKMPGITFCNSNPIKRTKFCHEYPNSCKKPQNMTDFCLKYPHMCSRNTSHLVIPKEGLIRPQQLLMKRNMSQEAWSTWTWDAPYEFDPRQVKKDITTSLVKGFYVNGYPTCYSDNLRLNNDLPAKTWPIIFPPGKFTENIVERYVLHLDDDESFDPWDIAQVSLVVHSPFVPVLPLEEGKTLPKGFIYQIYVKLEEEHLLSYPYETDCIDYEALWRKNNKTGPRSQEVCRQWCLWNNYKKWNKFPQGIKMVLFSENMCKLNSKNQLEPKECMKNCKADCVKLKYSYKIIKYPLKQHWIGNEIRVEFSVDDPQIVIISHIPVYDTGDLFSYIGGLMGCWLGISVATFTNILESAFMEVKRLALKLRRYVG